MLNGANAEFNGTSAEFIDAAPDHDYSLQKRMGQRHLKGLKRDKSGPRLQKPAHVVPQPQTQTDEPVNLKRKDEREKYYHDGRQQPHCDHSVHHRAPQVYTPGYQKHQKPAPVPSIGVQVAQAAFVPVVVNAFGNCKFRF